SLDVRPLHTMRTIDTEDWELFVAFIRLEFPAAQRDTAQRLAVSFAGLVGRAIATLRPEHTIEEIVAPIGADSLDAHEFVPAILAEQGITTGEARFGTWTFRELVEYANAELGSLGLSTTPHHQ